MPVIDAPDDVLMPITRPAAIPSALPGNLHPEALWQERQIRHGQRFRTDLIPLPSTPELLSTAQNKGVSAILFAPNGGQRHACGLMSFRFQFGIQDANLVLDSHYLQPFLYRSS